jgi:hypothetical protein
VLRNRNYFKYFYGSGSDWVRVPVSTFDKAPAPYLDHKKQFRKICGKNHVFFIESFFTRKTFDKFPQVYCKM